MSWPVLTFRERAMLYNAFRDVEEIAYRVSEYIRPEWKKMISHVEVTRDGRVWLRVEEIPAYMNIVDALFTIRDLLRLVLEMDNEEKIKAIEEWWTAGKEEKVEASE